MTQMAAPGGRVKSPKVIASRECGWQTRAWSRNKLFGIGLNLSSANSYLRT